MPNASIRYEELDMIVAERFPDFELGKSINDRLERATTK
jgi:L-threonylcarbamoyladenylate synthase